MTGRLTPRAETLYVVRWLRKDGRDVKHRYYTRVEDAERFLASLKAGGWPARLFSATVEWRPEP